MMREDKFSRYNYTLSYIITGEINRAFNAILGRLSYNSLRGYLIINLGLSACYWHWFMLL